MTMFDIYSRQHQERDAQRRQTRQPRSRSEPYRSPPNVIGPGAIIGGGGGYEPTDRERAATHRFAQNAAKASAGTSRQPVVRNRERAAEFPVGPGGVVQISPALMASREVGVPIEFVEALVGHESGGDTTARAPTSTATGAAQFTEQTWIDMIQRYGERYGADDLARQVDSKGKVANAALRREILDLRNNPQWAALMAAHYGQENAAELRARLGRSRLTEGEVYLAHFLGPQQGARVIQRALTPGDRTPAINLVSRDAAASNGRIFYVGGNYDRDGRYLGGGRPATAREVYDRQTRAFRNASWPTESTGRAQTPGFRAGLGMPRQRP